MAPEAPDERLEALVAGILASAKYREVLPDLVRVIARRELEAGRGAKGTVAAVRARLHQVAGAFLPGRMRYDAWLAPLEAAAAAGESASRAACRAVMAHHASTRERLSILDAFYATTLAGIAPPRSVLDVACGLNPLAIPWMPLAPGARYIACDVYRDLVAFLGSAMALLGAAGEAQWRDAVHDAPRDEVDLALVLKAIPCLEQLDKEAGRKLLEGLSARHVLVSFPVASLGGRAKGMVATYDARMEALLAGHAWRAERFLFATELAYLVRK